MSDTENQGGAEPLKVPMTFHFGQGVPVPESMKAGAVASDAALHDQMSDAFRAQGVDEAVLAQRGKPVSQQEYDLAQHKRRSLLQDKAWAQKYMDGDQDARRTMATLSIILGSPIKHEEPANG